MKKISAKEFILKSSLLLEKYRHNINQLRKQRDEYERKFFFPYEMIEYFHTNKSEYQIWSRLQQMISTLEEAYGELADNMMSALSSPDDYNYYLKDQRITIIEEKQVFEVEEEEEEAEVNFSTETNSD